MPNTTHFKNMVSGALFGKSAVFNVPDTYYLAVSTTQASEDGTNFTEPTDPAYGNTTFVNAGISGQSNEATMLEITSSYNNISNLKFKNSQTNKCAGIILKGESSKYAIANQIFSCIIEDLCYSTPPKPAYGILSGMYSSGVIGFGNIIRKCDEQFF